VVGDTPLDVAAAHADGVRAIAIGGFRYTRDDLIAAGADAAIDELDEVADALSGQRARSSPSARP